MGRSRVIPIVIEYLRAYSLRNGRCHPARITSGEWPRSPYGRPSSASLARVITDFEASTRSGGVNAHLGEMQVTAARVVRQRDGAVLATYEKPTFQVMDNPRRRVPRDNPSVLVFGNPPERTRPWDRATVVSKRAVAIEYDHVSDGKLYRHPFARGVVVEALVDGSVRLYRPDGKPLWKMFNR